MLSWAEHVLVKIFRLLIFKSIHPSVRQEADYNICGCWAEKSKWTTGGLLWLARAPHPWHLLWVQGLFPISTSRLVITTVAQTPGVNVEACVSVFLCLSVFLCACCKWKKEKKATAELSRTQNKKSLFFFSLRCQHADLTDSKMCLCSSIIQSVLIMSKVKLLDLIPLCFFPQNNFPLIQFN